MTSLSRVTMTGGTSCHHLTADDDDHDDDWNEDYDQDDGENGVDQHIHFLNQSYAMKGNVTHTVTSTRSQDSTIQFVLCKTICVGRTFANCASYCIECRDAASKHTEIAHDGLITFTARMDFTR